MNPERLMTIPCTITSRTQDDDNTDEYGNPTTDTTTTSTVCWYHQGAGGMARGDRSEETGLAEVTSERWTMYFPPATAVSSTATVSTPDGTFEVDGPPWPARHPRTGAVEYVLASAVRAG